MTDDEKTSAVAAIGAYLDGWCTGANVPADDFKPYAAAVDLVATMAEDGWVIRRVSANAGAE